jgi:MoxR-like ATPase
MAMDSIWKKYTGKGALLRDRGEELPPYEPLTGSDSPENYIASVGLRDAVNVALLLGQPLLITGEPGTGKTRLAASVAWELGLNYLQFHTKTTSTASDLFYHYDALRRFQDAQLGERRPMEEYISCRALGAAILLSNPTEQAVRILPASLKEKGPMRSVVLIDEIDKAPRDLPNDILNEIELMEFRIAETTWEPFLADPGLRPVLILTSNSEKNLPDAFLRRCVFFHMPFPDGESLKDIVRKRFDGATVEFSEGFLEAAVAIFEEVRKQNLRKKPATAEFLAWITMLRTMGVDLGQGREEDLERLELSCSLLAKSEEDLKLLKRVVAAQSPRS